MLNAPLENIGWILRPTQDVNRVVVKIAPLVIRQLVGEIPNASEIATPVSPDPQPPARRALRGSTSGSREVLIVVTALRVRLLDLVNLPVLTVWWGNIHCLVRRFVLTVLRVSICL